MERAQEPGQQLWRRAGATLGVVVVALLGLAAPVSIGVLGGNLVGGDALGLMVCMALGALVSVWWSRLVLTGLWWVRTGQWCWRRSSVRSSLDRARYGRPL